MVFIEQKTKEAQKLFLDGIKTLADIEERGIPIDVEYCQRKIESCSIRQIKIRKELERTRELQVWRREYGKKFNINSGPQLSKVLYKKLGYKVEKTTKKGNPSIDKEVLASYNTPFTKMIASLKQYQKVEDVLIGVFRETVDGFLHPNFLLNTVQTFRGSCRNPNYQNNPIRDPMMGKAIRRAFRNVYSDFRIGEIDYAGIEVKIAACYHQDPVMITYIKDKTKDMHRDMAMECFVLKRKQVTKSLRYYAKNRYVFPEFYGSYYELVAPDLWKAVEDPTTTLEDGTPLRDHLSDQGLGNYKRFEKHIEDVEYRFWNERFRVYNKWKKEWWYQYLKKGYVDMFTGFRCWGPLKRNECINYPVQGAAFHCLLWSLIQMNRHLRQWNTQIIGQIHDSMINLFDPTEQTKALSLFHKTMCEDIREQWPWIIVPLDIEAEIADSGKSWFDKQEVKIERSVA